MTQIWPLLPVSSSIEPACCICGTAIRREMRFAVIEDNQTGTAGLAHWICDINLRDAETDREARLQSEQKSLETALEARGYQKDRNVGTWFRRITAELDLVVSDGSGEAPRQWRDAILSVHPVCGEAVWDADVMSEEELDLATLAAWRGFGKKGKVQ